jgi:hypothetical protein
MARMGRGRFWPRKGTKVAKKERTCELSFLWFLCFLAAAIRSRGATDFSTGGHGGNRERQISIPPFSVGVVSSCSNPVSECAERSDRGLRG